jgi:ADP-ribosylglycohydrolase
MLGAIAGDIIGSVYESTGFKSKAFPLFGHDSRFTDDSVLTIAVARAILEGLDYRAAILELGRRYPDAGFSGQFRAWLSSESPRPYQSYGNGAAMRVSPVGFAFDREQDVLREARKTAEMSHDHPEGIKGAQATALAVLLARTGVSKATIRAELTARFEYDLLWTVDQIRPGYGIDLSCQGTVPQAVICFLESDSFEDAVRNAVSLGGDSDTLACIAGTIAHAFYGGLPAHIVAGVKQTLDTELWSVTERFCARYGIAGC